MNLVIVTGLSGAGKSQAANALEDMGYYCVDNIPPAIIPAFVDLSKRESEGLSKLAVVTDIDDTSYRTQRCDTHRICFQGTESREFQHSMGLCDHSTR